MLLMLLKKRENKRNKANIPLSMQQYGRFQGFHQGQGRQDDQRPQNRTGKMGAHGL